MASEQNINEQLMQAAKEGNLEEVRRLVESGADVNHGDITPFLWAYFEGHKDIVKYLLSKGGNIDHDKFVEGTLLTFTAFTGDVEFMIYLLDQGAEIDHAMPHGGETALFHAADTNQVAAAKLLIERGADVKHRTKTDGDSELRFGKFRRKFSGEMPLHVAAVSGDEEFVKILLDAGADKTAKTMNGETPYDYAVERGRPEQIIQLLRLE